MQISVQIENGNQRIFNALKAILKAQPNLNFHIEKNTGKGSYCLSKADEADFKETLRLLEKGELEFVSADEMRARTDKGIAKIKAKYA